MVGNHIALVDAGRCGSDVKVFDHKCTMDSLDLGGFESPLKTMDESGIIESKETKGIKMYVTIDEVRRLLTESFTYGDEVDPKVKLIMTALEAKAKETLDEDESKEEKKSEDSDEEKEEKKAEDKCGKDEDEEKESTDEDEKEDEKKETADSIKELMSVVKDMADDIKKLVAKDEEKDDEEKKESEDGDDSDDDSEEKESEDEDEEETKKSEDSAVFVFGTDSAIVEDEGLKEYLK